MRLGCESFGKCSTKLLAASNRAALLRFINYLTGEQGG